MVHKKYVDGSNFSLNIVTGKTKNKLVMILDKRVKLCISLLYIVSTLSDKLDKLFNWKWHQLSIQHMSLFPSSNDESSKKKKKKNENEVACKQNASNISN